MHTFK